MDTRLLWLALAAFVGSTEGGLIAGLLPGISEEMGVTIGQAGQVVLGYSLAYAIGPPILTMLLGHVGRRRILALAEFALALSALLFAISPFFGWMVAARTVLAVGAGLFTGTAIATAAVIAAPGQRGRALQIISTGQALAALFGVPIAAYVAARYSWRIDYAAISAMAALASLALFLRLPKGLLGDQQTIRERVRVLRNPGVPAALLTTLLFTLGAYPPTIYVGAVMHATGIARELLPYVLLASGVGAVGASLSAGHLSDRFGTRATIVATTLVMMLSLGLFGLLPVLPDVLRLGTLLLAACILGYMGWGYWIAHCSQMAELAPTSVPLAISLNLTSFNLGIALAAAVGGVIVDSIGANALALASAPFAILTLALAVWTGRKSHTVLDAG
ncbi:MAG TPA: MFS transporter [Devosia sp.]|nr:MFS transporter [Devosia sp.]